MIHKNQKCKKYLWTRIILTNEALSGCKTVIYFLVHLIADSELECLEARKENISKISANSPQFGIRVPIMYNIDENYQKWIELPSIILTLIKSIFH